MREMKDSGIEWIGSVPREWEIRKGKHLFRERNEHGNDISLQLLSPSQKYGVIPQSMLDSVVKVKEETDLSTFKTIHSGDYCISLRSFQGGFEYSQYEGVVSPAYHVFYPLEQICDNYYKYLFKSMGFIDYMASMPMTLRDGKNISFEMFGGSLIPIPPLSEQKKIAAYLDEKCSRIDAIIEKQQKIIEKLKEYKLSVITEAVTKGLDPNVPMKDSGVEWIGEIPESWTITKLKKLVVMISKGTTPSTIGKEIYSSGKIRFIKAENIQNNIVTLIPSFYIDEETNQILSRSQLQCNDILFVIAGATIGKTAIIDSDALPANTNQAVSFIRLIDVQITRYVWYYLQSYYIKTILNQLSVQSAQPNLSMKDMSDFIICMPSKDISNDIIMFLDKKCSHIDSIIQKRNGIIDKLTEYKKSLIYEVVTGKKEV